MKKIHVSWGPPATSGVQHIIGLGADEVAALTDKTDKALSMAGWISVGVWALGVVVNRKSFRNIGLGGAAASFAVKYLSR